jgi:hypothetical protein
MPQVPTYGAPKVARDPLSAGKLNPVQSNAGDVIGGALQGLGGALEDTGAVVHKLNEQHKTAHDAGASVQTRTDAQRAQLQAEQDAATVSDAELGYASATASQLGNLDNDSGFMFQQGRSALDLEPKVREALSQARQDQLEALPTTALRRRAEAMFDAQDAQTDELIDSHRQLQQRAYLDQAEAARIVGYKQQAASLHAIDPALFEQNLQRMDEAQRALDFRTGVPEADHLANQMRNRSDAWSSVIEHHIATGDFDGARRLMNDRAPEMTYADRGRLGGPVKDGGDLADARRFVDGAVKAGFAGWRGMDLADWDAAPPVGVDSVVHGIRKVAADVGASAAATQRVIAQAISGQIDGVEVGKGRGRASSEDASSAPLHAAFAQDSRSEAAATQALGHPPAPWQVDLVSKGGSAAGTALLSAAASADATAVLGAAGVPQGQAASLLSGLGLQAGAATVGQALEAARDGYARTLNDKMQGHAASPHARYTPNAIPDQTSLADLAVHAAGDDPDRQIAFKGVANTAVNQAAAAKDKRRQDALNGVSDLLVNRVPYSQWPPALQAALDDPDRKAFAKAEAHPAPPEGDPEQFAIVRQAYADGELDAFNPSDLIGVLNPDQFRQYMQWRQDVQKNGGQGPTQGQVVMRRLLGAAKEAAVTAGSGPGFDNARSRKAGEPPGVQQGEQPISLGQVSHEGSPAAAARSINTAGSPAQDRALPSSSRQRREVGDSGSGQANASVSPSAPFSQSAPDFRAEDGLKQSSIAPESRSLLIKDADHGSARSDFIPVKGEVRKDLQGLKELYDKVHEPLEPFEKAFEAYKLARAILKTGHDIRDDDLIKKGDVTIDGARWTSAVRDEDGKRIGEVHVTEDGWEYEDDWDGTGTHPHVHNNPINWQTAEQVRFNEFKAYLDRSDFGEGSQEIAEFFANAISANLAGFGLKMALKMDPKTYARVKEIAFELRLMQLLNARTKVGAVR